MEATALKLCECGCGNPAPIAKFTSKSKGHIKGQAVRFIVGHKSKIQPTGNKSYSWKGGLKNNGDGRVKEYTPFHPRADGEGYVLRYILKAEKALGKYLPPKAVIHHTDEVVSNDENANLIICQDNAYHHILHQRQRAYKACGHAFWRKCCICKKHDDPSNLYILPKGNSAYHKSCKSELQKYKKEQKYNGTSRN